MTPSSFGNIHNSDDTTIEPDRDRFEETPTPPKDVVEGRFDRDGRKAEQQLPRTSEPKLKDLNHQYREMARGVITANIEGIDADESKTIATLHGYQKVMMEMGDIFNEANEEVADNKKKNRKLKLSKAKEFREKIVKSLSEFYGVDEDKLKEVLKDSGIDFKSMTKIVHRLESPEQEAKYRAELLTFLNDNHKTDSEAVFLEDLAHNPYMEIAMACLQINMALGWDKFVSRVDRHQKNLPDRIRGVLDPNFVDDDLKKYSPLERKKVRGKGIGLTALTWGTAGASSAATFFGLKKIFSDGLMEHSSPQDMAEFLLEKLEGIGTNPKWAENLPDTDLITLDNVNWFAAIAGILVAANSAVIKSKVDETFLLSNREITYWQSVLVHMDNVFRHRFGLKGWLQMGVVGVSLYTMIQVVAQQVIGSEDMVNQVTGMFGGIDNVLGLPGVDAQSINSLDSGINLGQFTDPFTDINNTETGATPETTDNLTSIAALDLDPQSVTVESFGSAANQYGIAIDSILEQLAEANVAEANSPGKEGMGPSYDMLDSLNISGGEYNSADYKFSGSQVKARECITEAVKAGIIPDSSVQKLDGGHLKVNFDSIPGFEPLAQKLQGMKESFFQETISAAKEIQDGKDEIDAARSTGIYAEIQAKLESNAIEPAQDYFDNTWLAKMNELKDMTSGDGEINKTLTRNVDIANVTTDYQASLDVKVKPVDAAALMESNIPQTVSKGPNQLFKEKLEETAPVAIAIAGGGVIAAYLVDFANSLGSMKSNMKDGKNSQNNLPKSMEDLDKTQDKVLQEFCTTLGAFRGMYVIPEDPVLEMIFLEYIEDLHMYGEDDDDQSWSKRTGRSIGRYFTKPNATLKPTLEFNDRQECWDKFLADPNKHRVAIWKRVMSVSFGEALDNSFDKVVEVTTTSTMNAKERHQQLKKIVTTKEAKVIEGKPKYLDNQLEKVQKIEDEQNGKLENFEARLAKAEEKNDSKVIRSLNAQIKKCHRIIFAAQQDVAKIQAQIPMAAVEALMEYGDLEVPDSTWGVAMQNLGKFGSKTKAGIGAIWKGTGTDGMHPIMTMNKRAPGKNTRVMDRIGLRMGKVSESIESPTDYIKRQGESMTTIQFRWLSENIQKALNDPTLHYLDYYPAGEDVKEALISFVQRSSIENWNDIVSAVKHEDFNGEHQSRLLPYLVMDPDVRAKLLLPDLDNSERKQFRDQLNGAYGNGDFDFYPKLSQRIGIFIKDENPSAEDIADLRFAISEMPESHQDLMWQYIQLVTVPKAVQFIDTRLENRDAKLEVYATLNALKEALESGEINEDLMADDMDAYGQIITLCAEGEKTEKQRIRRLLRKMIMSIETPEALALISALLVPEDKEALRKKELEAESERALRLRPATATAALESIEKAGFDLTDESSGNSFESKINSIKKSPNKEKIAALSTTLSSSLADKACKDARDALLLGKRKKSKAMPDAIATIATSLADFGLEQDTDIIAKVRAFESTRSEETLDELSKLIAEKAAQSDTVKNIVEPLEEAMESQLALINTPPNPSPTPNTEPAPNACKQKVIDAGDPENGTLPISTPLGRLEPATLIPGNDTTADGTQLTTKADAVTIDGAAEMVSTDEEEVMLDQGLMKEVERNMEIEDPRAVREQLLAVKQPMMGWKDTQSLKLAVDTSLNDIPEDAGDQAISDAVISVQNSYDLCSTKSKRKGYVKDIGEVLAQHIIPIDSASTKPAETLPMPSLDETIDPAKTEEKDKNIDQIETDHLKYNIEGTKGISNLKKLFGDALKKDDTGEELSKLLHTFQNTNFEFDPEASKRKGTSFGAAKSKLTPIIRYLSRPNSEESDKRISLLKSAITGNTDYDFDDSESKSPEKLVEKPGIAQFLGENENEQRSHMKVIKRDMPKIKNRFGKKLGKAEKELKAGVEAFTTGAHGKEDLNTISRLLDRIITVMEDPDSGIKPDNKQRIALQNLIEKNTGYEFTNKSAQPEQLEPKISHPNGLTQNGLKDLRAGLKELLPPNDTK